MKKTITFFLSFALFAIIAINAFGIDAAHAAASLASLQFDSGSGSLLFSMAAAGMTTLAANSHLAYELGDVNSLPVIASDIIYQGAAVGDNGSGYARPLQSGDPFRGFAIEKADNSAGSAGDINVQVKREGYVQLSVTSAAITDVGRPVYASDDATFNLTGIGTKVGRIVRFVSSGVAIVEFDADEPEQIIKLALPISLSGVSAADVLTDLVPGFNGRVKSLDFAVGVPVTTAAKAAALHAEIGATALTGGVVSLNSANCTPLGAVVADTAITDGAAFKETDTLSIVASAVTAFVEGDGVLYVTLGQ